ncbi:MAG: HAD hydrolase-like protein [candidate division Zixibacteria bacterium]|nr:HAD hydrolase-like protein [candidate division Zixibacteria bacterium]
MAISFVYFDLDDTLIDTTNAVIDAYAAALAEIKPAVVDAGCEPASEAIEEELIGTFGSTMPDEYFNAWLYEAGVDSGLRRELAARGTAIFLRRTREIEPFPEAKPVLEWLVKKGVGRGIISDGRVEEQRAKLEHAGLAQLIGPVFVSEDYPVFKGKPSLAMFEDALAAAKAPAGAVMYVGDQAKDVIGANLAGMISVRVLQGWANRKPPSKHFAAARPAHIIANLGELPDVIRRHSAPEAA